jgi:hypothetical protein
MSSGNTGVAAEFTPVLSAYVVTGFQQNQIIKTQIQGSINFNLSKNLNLADPSINLNWSLEQSPEGYKLVPM